MLCLSDPVGVFKGKIVPGLQHLGQELEFHADVGG